MQCSTLLPWFPSPTQKGCEHVHLPKRVAVRNEQDATCKAECQGHSKSSIKASYCNDSQTSSPSSSSNFIRLFSTSPQAGSFNGNRGLQNFFSQSRKVPRGSRKWIPTAFPQINLTRSLQEKKPAPSVKEQSILSTQGPVCHRGLPRWKMYAAIKESPAELPIRQCQLSLTERLLTLAHC